MVAQHNPRVIYVLLEHDVVDIIGAVRPHVGMEVNQTRGLSRPALDSARASSKRAFEVTSCRRLDT